MDNDLEFLTKTISTSLGLKDYNANLFCVAKGRFKK